MRWPRRSGRPSRRAFRLIRRAWPSAARVSEPDESDRIEGFAHPRETARLIGQDVALARAARAIRSGKPPQAWLISGPPGIGKATLAYRIARYLLAYGATRQRRGGSVGARQRSGSACRSRPARIPACWC